MFHLTTEQVKRLQEMRSKNYPITSLRFHPIEGHITVGVRVGQGTRYFFVGQKGQLKV
jgi:hypothetical protein